MALAMGSPGASRITTTILQGWIRLGFEGMGFEDMVRAPRLHVEKIDGEFVLQHEPELEHCRKSLRKLDPDGMFPP